MSEFTRAYKGEQLTNYTRSKRMNLTFQCADVQECNMKLTGAWWSYSGNTYLDLARNGSFTLESAGGRYWGRWEGPSLFSSSVTFHIDGQQAGKVVCRCDSGTDRSTGSTWIELRSRSGSPLDGKWYLRKS